MEHMYATTVLQPVCPDCGAEVTAVEHDLDWHDDHERTLGANALAVQQHRATAHPVAPKVGDVVVYFAPWRGMILGVGPLVVRGVEEHDMYDFARSMGADLPVLMGVKYHLVNPVRSSDYYLPSTGDPDRPVTFEIITEYSAPVVEMDLLDLLGAEWQVPA